LQQTNEPILLGEYMILRPEEAKDPEIVRERELYLLLRAENMRLQTQGEWGQLVKFEFTQLGPIKPGFTRTAQPDGGLRLEWNCKLESVRADDGALNDEGHFIPFPQLKVSKEGQDAAD
jgi:hypothetical protein